MTPSPEIRLPLPQLKELFKSRPGQYVLMLAAGNNALQYTTIKQVINVTYQITAYTVTRDCSDCAAIRNAFISLFLVPRPKLHPDP